MVLCICGTFWDQNHTLLSNKKVDESKSHFYYWGKNDWKCLILYSRIDKKIDYHRGWIKITLTLFVKKVKKMLCGGGRGHARLSGKKVNNKVPCILDVIRGKIWAEFEQKLTFWALLV